MMNRRLRERLTEAEILQIFVDVCEGVACMHNSRPPLLHRDLKVENILQSSTTSYKLCDFGSATAVAKPPANTLEIRALEADLNRYTTLQYRAPEMVDLYSRRPVDEKSDVWALGVLLYKLCYYTTPFEEHGPLAITNVHYRIPPYPVYSAQMNQLIGACFVILVISIALIGFCHQIPCFKNTAAGGQPFLSYLHRFIIFVEPNRVFNTRYLYPNLFLLDIRHNSSQALHQITPKTRFPPMRRSRLCPTPGNQTQHPVLHRHPKLRFMLVTRLLMIYSSCVGEDQQVQRDTCQLLNLKLCKSLQLLKR
jgi:serine/threonine protein kinase